MRRIIQAGLVVFLMLGSTAGAQTVGEAWVGDWEVAGSNPDGSPYNGTVTIWRTGDTYQVEWIVGDQIFSGTGIAVGDLLSVGYDGGVAVYSPGGKGQLYGTWSPIGGDMLGTEVLSGLTSSSGNDI